MKSRTIRGVLFDFDGTLTFPGALDFPALKHEMNCPEDMPILEYLENLPSGRREELLPKSHPDGVYQAAKQMGIVTSELLVVGDFRFDILAGKAAGCPTALLTNGRHSTPGDPQPDYTVTSLEEIPQIISQTRTPGSADVA